MKHVNGKPVPESQADIDQQKIDAAAAAAPSPEKVLLEFERRQQLLIGALPGKYSKMDVAEVDRKATRLLASMLPDRDRWKVQESEKAVLIRDFLKANEALEDKRDVLLAGDIPEDFADDQYWT